MKLNYNYIRDNEFAPAVLMVDGRQVHNPSEAMYLAQGYTKVVHRVPTEAEVAEAERTARMNDLQELIAKTDWKIIKTMEYRLLGLPDPYDVAELHTERQPLRDEYNELENYVDNH